MYAAIRLILITRTNPYCVITVNAYIMIDTYNALMSYDIVGLIYNCVLW